MQIKHTTTEIMDTLHSCDTHRMTWEERGRQSEAVVAAE